VFTALVAFSILALSTGIGRAQTIAQAQAEILATLKIQNPRLTNTITLLNASAAALANATSTVETSNTVPGLTAEQIAVAALSPVTVTVRGNLVPEVRADRNTSAGLVGEKVIVTRTPATPASLPMRQGLPMDWLMSMRPPPPRLSPWSARKP
jgi:hypothetical protein